MRSMRDGGGTTGLDRGAACGVISCGAIEAEPTPEEKAAEEKEAVEVKELCDTIAGWPAMVAASYR